MKKSRTVSGQTVQELSKKCGNCRQVISGLSYKAEQKGKNGAS